MMYACVFETREIDIKRDVIQMTSFSLFKLCSRSNDNTSIEDCQYFNEQTNHVMFNSINYVFTI
jgi:hypothetical protein